ncbi:MAG: DUF4240 domain-containing protein [Bacteroidia bacterium]|nr:DUF4240 domain-containing protein [Bacteroidia bacterium]
MKIEQFWEIIDETRKNAVDLEDHMDFLIEELLKKSVKEIISYQGHFEAQMERLSNVPLWLAGLYIMNIQDETEMEEQFPYLCAWIITQGKEAVDAVIENADNIAPYLTKDKSTSQWNCECEMMLYVADNAYEMKTGKEDFYELFDSEPFFEIKGEFPESTPDYILMFPKISLKLNS